MVQNNWRTVDLEHTGLMNIVNQQFHVLDVKNPEALPNFDGTSQLVLGSDYSGQQTGSVYESYGFILTDLARLGDWFETRASLRRRYHVGSRRLSYKTAGERKRQRMLPEFLQASDSIPGIVVVFLVRKEITSLFSKIGKLDVSELAEPGLDDWKHTSVERLLRVCHFASLLVTGLSHPGQNLMWLTDEDDIVANEAMHRTMVKVFGNIVSHYLQHSLGHIRIGTAKSDPGSREIEDLLAITDLAAGAVSEAFNGFVREDLPIAEKIVSGVPDSISPKARTIMNWFSQSNQPLRRQVFSFEPVPDSTAITVRHLRLHGSHELF